MRKVILSMLLALTTVTGFSCRSTPSYTVLAGSMSIVSNGEQSFSVSPAKVHVNRQCDIPITISNFSGHPVDLVVSVEDPNRVTEGYTALWKNDEYRVVTSTTELHLEDNEVQIISASVEKKLGIGDKKMESWVSFAEVADKGLLTTLCTKILIR